MSRRRIVAAISSDVAAMTAILRRAVLVWLAIIAAESVLGALRVLFLEPAIGSMPARRAGVFVALGVIFALTFATRRFVGARSDGERLGAGALWVALTVAFEIGLGRFILGYGWDRILEDYDPGRGGLMGFGLLAMGLAPWLVGKLASR